MDESTGNRLHLENI